MRPTRIEPKPGQESVWDYPRPPRVEPFSGHIVITFNGQKIVNTYGAYRVLETSHPPTYYVPLADVRQEFLVPSTRSSFCEWKGRAVYWTLRVNGKVAEDVGWSYPDPTPGFEGVKDYLAFYAGPMDACLVNGEKVKPQPGGFYGGWVTSNIVGPFKGEPGTSGW